MLIHKKLSGGGSWSRDSSSRRLLGNGPLRFAPQTLESSCKEQRSSTKSIQEQINALNASERACFEHLKQKWEKKCYSSSDPKNGTDVQQLLFSNEMLLRFLRCSAAAGAGGGADNNKAFHERAAWKIMKAYPQRCRHLTAASLEQQLQTKVSDPLRDNPF
jgi:hypothetical protein